MYLGIDLGSSAVKTVLVDRARERDSAVEGGLATSRSCWMSR